MSAVFLGLADIRPAAILSQAFDQRHPVLEANTRRLLCRLFAIEQPLRDKAIEKQLWRFAEAMLPHERCGDFNQALMELGALVCKPQKPACQHCPVNRYCLACQRKLQNSIPSGRKKRTIPVHEVALVARRADSFLLVRRPAKGRWSNMWEFPHGSVDNGQSLEQAAAQLLGELTGLRGRIGEPFFSLTHGVMHYRIRLNCFVVDRVRGKFSSSFYPAHQWVLPGEFDQYPLSSPQRRLADCVLKLFGSKRSEQNAQ
ncbi:MAG: hypothetical protein KatS3mg105_4428 [Gemmatales bacterium]|nr:MAG: hypothetical protein KatS3mg105_4428 [Gemmatales bacterium]